MNKQEAAIAKLEKQGYRFCNWIPFHPDAENEPVEGTENQQTAVMLKKTGNYLREYREVDPEGNVN